MRWLGAKQCRVEVYHIKPASSFESWSWSLCVLQVLPVMRWENWSFLFVKSHGCRGHTFCFIVFEFVTASEVTPCCYLWRRSSCPCRTNYHLLTIFLGRSACSGEQRNRKWGAVACPWAEEQRGRERKILSCSVFLCVWKDVPWCA